ncbi:MAG: CTP synthase [Lachnospiraceae bacterium]|nr:CTP synthase [Lachnospiraceae bacterium]
MEAIQTFLSICGAISIIGGAGAVILKLIRPAFKINKRVEQLEEYNEMDYKRLKALEEMQKQQSKCLAAMLNHQITGNGIDNMKKIRDELLESIIDK